MFYLLVTSLSCCGSLSANVSQIFSNLIFAFSPASGKLPKNYDPKATPDLERWLPMRERSYYRGKKKGKKKEQIGKGTQGATAGASAEL